MNIKKRRIIYLAIIAIFLFLAPLIILKNSGFRYDFKKNRLVKTGSLVLESYPNNASIFLDGKPYNNFFIGGAWKTFFRTFLRVTSATNTARGTPLIINDLIPNEYLVEFKKNGYKNWSQKINIKGGEATFCNDALLFLEKPIVKPLAQGEIILAEISPNNKMIAYLAANNQLSLMNLITGKTEILNQQKNSPLSLAWSPDSKKIMITQESNQKNYYSIFNLDNKTLTDINKFLGYNNLQKIKWDDSGSDLLLGRRQNAIYKISLPAKTINLILEKGPKQTISDFLFRGDTIFLLLQNNENDYCLQKTNLLSGKDDSSCLIDFSDNAGSNGDYQLSLLNDEFLLIAGKNQAKVMVINVAKKKIVAEAVAKKSLFLPRLNQLAYSNNFEISGLNLDQDKTELTGNIFGRFSSEIINLQAQNQENLIILALKSNSGNEEIVYAIDLIYRNGYNLMPIMAVDQLYSFMPSNNRDYFYALAKINDVLGIYQIVIH